MSFADFMATRRGGGSSSAEAPASAAAAPASAAAAPALRTAAATADTSPPASLPPPPPPARAVPVPVPTPAPKPDSDDYKDEMAAVIAEMEAMDFEGMARKAMAQLPPGTQGVTMDMVVNQIKQTVISQKMVSIHHAVAAKAMARSCGESPCDYHSYGSGWLSKAGTLATLKRDRYVVLDGVIDRMSAAQLRSELDSIRDADLLKVTLQKATNTRDDKMMWMNETEAESRGAPTLARAIRTLKGTAAEIRSSLDEPLTIPGRVMLAECVFAPQRPCRRRDSAVACAAFHLSLLSPRSRPDTPEMAHGTARTRTTAPTARAYPRTLGH